MKSIRVGDNPYFEPPVEIMVQGREAIQFYYQNERERLGEIKILLVGQGEAGKTSVVRRLLDDDFRPDEPQTHGIIIRKEDLRKYGVETMGRFWDFGGQEIMHSTHKFFLSKRSIYLLVLNARKDENPDYWLRHIEAYGAGAPTLILFNKIDENPAFDLDRRALREKYPFIEDFLPVSAKTGKGISDLRQKLLELVQEHPLAESRFPKTWLAVRDALEEEGKDHINYEHFREICRLKGVSDETNQEYLLRALHDLGIVLHFEKLRGFDTQILNPRWLTNAVYRIVNSPFLSRNQGVLRVSEVGDMLRDERYGSEPFSFPPEKHLFIVQVMEQFELCYEVERNQTYIVPEQLPPAGGENAPLEVHAGERQVRLLVKFPEFLPTSIFPRFMVRTHQWIVEGCRWRTAMQLEERDLTRSRARITEDRAGRVISIEVCGRDPRQFLTILRKELAAICRGFPNLKVEEHVPLEDKATVTYDTLAKYEKRNMPKYFCPELDKEFDVSELLDGIEEKEQRSEEGKVPVSVFVSYAHADEENYRALSEFKKRVSPWMRIDNVDLWDDGVIVPGQKWRKEILRKLEQADIVVCLLSPSFTASDFCWDIEMGKAMEAAEKGEKEIFVVRLIDIGYDDLPIQQYQAAPEKWINPNTSGDPRHELWAEMARAFGEVLEAVKRKKLERSRQQTEGMDRYLGFAGFRATMGRSHL